MENVWLNEFVDAIAPFYSLWQCVRVSGAAININGGWFNIAMQMEVLETKPEVRSSSLASLDFLHYQFDYPLTGMRELILETLKNGFFTLGAAGSGTTNRLRSVSLPGTSGTVSFNYDPFGRRIYKSTPSATSIYAFDGDNLIEETNSSGAVVARYSRGLNIDEPLAMLRSSTTSFYQADGLGSITSLSSGAGALALTYTFNSFGKQTASTGSLVNSFQYTGRESDPETGLYYYRARYYDPNAGRFLSEDPLGFEAGINKYVYVENRPIIPNTSSNLRHGPHGDAEETSAAEQRHCNNERRVALAAASFLGAFRGH